MSHKFVSVLCDVDCTWDLEKPIYRVFVNNELFTERTWIWKDYYLEEMLPISAKPGQYRIRFELMNPHSCTLITNNLRIDQGQARIFDNNMLEIFE